MRIIKSEKRLCTCCMEEHEVKIVLIEEQSTFKKSKVNYEAIYAYCDVSDELYVNEQQMQENDKRLKNAYRKKEELLTSEEIVAVRVKYGISQSDFCTLLGWGGKTITRYESYQVQDKAHDTILKKINRDPEWFLSLLKDARNNLRVDLYQKYFDIASTLYEKDYDQYLRKAIEANYAIYQGNAMFQGNTELSLDKVVEVIRYFASSTYITSLYKVKLMKLIWYADALSYKTRGYAITGMVYQALPMGAVPIAHDSIIDLHDVPCEEVDMGETTAYHFELKEPVRFSFLSQEDLAILNSVIKKLGKMTKKEIIEFMHKEKAYTETKFKSIIQFKYAESLQI